MFWLEMALIPCVAFLVDVYRSIAEWVERLFKHDPVMQMMLKEATARQQRKEGMLFRFS